MLMSSSVLYAFLGYSLIATRLERMRRLLAAYAVLLQIISLLIILTLTKDIVVLISFILSLVSGRLILIIILRSAFLIR
jgi:hypothetical protein